MTAQPATQTQTGRTCGDCRVEATENADGSRLDFAIVLCTLHAKAKALLEALESFWRGVYGSSELGQRDAREHGFDPERHSCPHGNTPFYPAHGWWCGDCCTALEDAIAAAKGGAE